MKPSPVLALTLLGAALALAAPLAYAGPPRSVDRVLRYFLLEDGGAELSTAILGRPARTLADLEMFAARAASHPDETLRRELAARSARARETFLRQLREYERPRFRVTDLDPVGVRLLRSWLAVTPGSAGTLVFVEVDRQLHAYAGLTERFIGAERLRLDAHFARGGLPREVNLQGADLAGLRLEAADFRGASLEFADLSRADLPAAVFDSTASRDYASFAGPTSTTPTSRAPTCARRPSGMVLRGAPR